MIKFVFTLIALSFQTALALQMEGDITQLNGRKYISVKSENKNYLLTGATPIMATYINKLSEGDFVSVDGHRATNQTAISVNSINYVGLKDLLGTWSDDDENCYVFSSYTDFTVSESCNLRNETEYTYLINPHSQQWVMLVAGRFDSYVGDFEIVSKKVVQIDLYNSAGRIVRNLKLKKKLSE
jgi:hypothetical protein